MNKLKVIITGANGMVGEGVLYECLQHTEVEIRDMKVLENTVEKK
jgi:N-acetyl-gamma-glutamylphosphate reductase